MASDFSKIFKACTAVVFAFVYKCVEKNGNVINSVSFSAYEPKETKHLGGNNVIFAVGRE